MLKVNTIYPAFMGEVSCVGIGAPCTFVRLAGCNLRCYAKTMGILCDTPEALCGKDGKEMHETEILVECQKLGNKVICLTGGEPLWQNVKDLLVMLSNCGFTIIIETNGSILIEDYRHIRNVHFVVDVKGSSTGESERMCEDNYSMLDENDFVKFVVDKETEFQEVADWFISHKECKAKIGVGTFWGSKITYSKLFQFIQNWNIPAYLNMQTHKMMCMYDKFKDSENFSKISIPREL